MRRLLFICHGLTEAQRSGRFPLDERLADGAAIAAAGLDPVGGSGIAVCAPERRTRETAALLGLTPRSEPALADQDYGSWAGRSLTDPEVAPELAAWTRSASAHPPGGESFAEVVVRIGAWMDALPGQRGTIVAVTHPAIVRAALSHALALAPIETAYRVDLEPFARVLLTHDGGRWKLRLGSNA